MTIFSEGELEAMRVMWEHGEMKPPEIQERLPHAIQNGTLRYQLNALVKRGHVSRRRVGKAFYYKAVTPRRGTFKEMAARMANAFTRGSQAGLILELIQTEKLSHEEIELLQEVAKAKAKENAERSTGGTES